MKCIVQKTGSVNCHICDKKFITNLERKTKYMCKCSEHENYIAICGLPIDICDECKNIGWVSISGSGGGTGVRNIKTNEYRQ